MAYDPSDILGHVNSSNSNSQRGEAASRTDSDYLKSIDNSLKKLLNRTMHGSMSNAAAGSWARKEDDDPEQTFRIRYKDRQKKETQKRQQSAADDFFDGLESELKKGLLGSDFDDKIKEIMTGFAEALGVSLKDVPNQLGKVIGKELIYELRSWNVTSGAFATLRNGIDGKFGDLSKKFGEWTSNLGDYLDKMGWRGSWRRGTESTFQGKPDQTALTLYQQKKRQESDGPFNSSGPSTAANASAASVSVSIPSVNSLAMQTVDKLLIASVNELVLNSDRRENNNYPEVRKSSDGDYTDDDPSYPSSSSSSRIKDALVDKAKDLAIDKAKEEGMKYLTKSSTSHASTALAMIGTQELAKTGGQAATKAIATKAGGALAAKGGALVAANGGAVALAGTAGSAFPPLLAAIAAVALAVKVVQFRIEQFKKAVQPLIDGWKGYKEAFMSAANRVTDTRKRNQELGNERFQKDVETIIRKPFEILEDAANKMYEAWDANLRTINQTQGYNKNQLSELIGNYAQRIRSEGLSSVINAADLTNNLSKVLDSGLSGAVAEEFAYIATKLNAAIPTQDFFGYAQSYGEIIANATLQGKSQANAIAIANAELQSFANNLLYAQRRISSGVTTGLQDGAGLFGSSVRIANTGRAESSSAISGVITTVASVVGGLAPDLANALVEVVERAATGGNASELVALRSLAGINAGNTEFLRALVSDPQKTFTQLFRGLGSMQNMSEANYMEVAEGLSDIFGVSADALARVDFNYLADAISGMNIGSDALHENLQLLASGQSTLTAEQLRSRQINKYMLDEGLTYVLDNEAARSIQEHLWQEQTAREMMQAEYGVNLQGKSLEFLEGISMTIQNILDFLNPMSWMKKIGEVFLTAVDAAALNVDLAQVLQLGAVGGVNLQQLNMLTQRNVDFTKFLTLDYVSLLGGISSYGIRSTAHDIYSGLTNSFLGSTELHKMSSILTTSYAHLVGQTIENAINLRPKSKYSWGTVSKSQADAIRSLYTAAGSANGLTYTSTTTTQSSTEQAQASANSKFDEFVSTLDQAAKDGTMSFEDWLKTSANHGIADVEDAMKTAGRTQNELMQRWQQVQSKAGSEEQHARYVDEKTYRDDSYKEYTGIHVDTTGIHVDTTELIRIMNEVTNPELQDIQDDTTELIRILNDATNPTLAASLLQQTGIHTDTTAILSYLKDPIGVRLKSIDTNLSSFFNAWNGYWIKRSVYDASYNYEKVREIQQAEKDESKSVVFALAQALTSNDTKLQDPLVQNNALLSQILLVTQAILQEASKPTTGDGQGLWQTLQGLALGGVTQA